MSSAFNEEDMLYDLINLTADEWNQCMALNLEHTVEDLRELITARGLAIADERIKVEVDKASTQAMGEMQKEEDLDNVHEYNGSPNDDIINRATLLDKYTVIINGDVEEIGSIALTGKILVGFDFSNGDFSYSYFCHCTFYNCIFNNASLENMVITNCTFTRCSFDGADFTSSTIARSRFFETNLDEVAFDYTSISDCSFLVSNFNDTSFIQSKILYTGFSDSEGVHSDWKDTNVIQCSFSNTDLSNSDFKRASLVDDIFIRSNMSGCDFSSVTVTCLTITMTLVPQEFQELFEINHLLSSPAIFEWEPMLQEAVDDDIIQDVDIEDDEDRPW